MPCVDKSRLKVAKSGWWKTISRSRRALIWLIQVNHLDTADLIRMARPFKCIESKATKRGHHHIHSPPGSKLIKRHARPMWDKMRLELKTL